jgi:hypothetical protein
MITTIRIFFSTDKRKIKMVLPFHQIGVTTQTALYLTKTFKTILTVPQRLQQLDLSPFFLTIFSNQGTSYHILIYKH